LDEHPNKIYVELGALDGVRYSNTKLLEDSFGWTGILIEANPIAFENLTKQRPRNHLVNACISDSTEPLIFDYFENEHLAAVSSPRQTRTAAIEKTYYTHNPENTWLNQQLSCLKSIEIECKTLGDTCRNSPFREFAFLSLDVEGHELNVLKSHDWSIIFDLILVEENDNTEIEPFLGLRGYTRNAAIANNSVYLHSSYAQQSISG
jgi:FkbM family methyltransferase